MRIAFVPIDNRPVCYNLAKDIVAVDEGNEIILPDRNLLGGLSSAASKKEILRWLENLSDIDAMVISLDTVAYGGLVQSRRSQDNLDEIKSDLSVLKQILKSQKCKIYAFSSIMRISNNNYNIEEKVYWSEYGEKIFKYSYDSDFKNQLQNPEQYGIPQSIIDDYLKTRNRNFEVNKIYLNWQKEGLFDTLIFAKDDSGQYGLNVSEARQLQNLGAKVQTGADEIPLSLLARTLNKNIKIYPFYTSEKDKTLISKYEDIAVEQSVKNQIDLAGFTLSEDVSSADLVLVINNFEVEQGEIVMKVDTKNFDGSIPDFDKSCLYADIRFANGADNNFVEEILKKQYNTEKFYGYAGWNTTANTLGSLLCMAKFKYNAVKYNDNAFRKLQFIRFSDDWAYQANVRQTLESLIDITGLMENFNVKILDFLNLDKPIKCNYTYPWNRFFEIEVDCEFN